MQAGKQPLRQSRPRGFRGPFVVLEGPDGTGTTTQAALLTAALELRGEAVCRTQEPSDGPLGAICRAHVRRELTLDTHAAALAFMADRMDHLAHVIRPAVQSGSWVVCDRYLLSTLAYQGAEGVDQRWILQCSEPADTPDLTLFLEASPRVREDRLSSRQLVERYEDPASQRQLDEAYASAIELLRQRGHRIEIVRAEQAAQAVHTDILARLPERS